MIGKIFHYIKKFLYYIISGVVLSLTVGILLFFYPPPSIVKDADPFALEIKKIQANGLDFAYIEEGQGPLVLLLHGFPDNAHTWDETMHTLSKNGYHAVAPFMRGYYPTEIPKDGDYSAETLGKDALGLIDALGYEKAVIVGNDWGATAAYAAANIDPVKVNGLVALGIPHPQSVKADPEVFRKLPHFLLFQFGPLSDWYASRNDFAYITSLYSYWSPSWQVPWSFISQMKEDFSRHGRLTAALRYYHFAILDNFDSRKTKLYKTTTTVPTLVMAGDDDIMYKLGMFDDMADAFSGQYDLIIVLHAGHFIQREQPELLDEKLLIFLKSLPK